jgi:hypothetical protein
MLEMDENRLRIGPLAATVGSALLALSVFQPWYALRLTAAGVSSAQQALNSLALQLGNASLQGQARTVSGRFSALTGRQLATLSAAQTLKYIHVILLILAAAVFLSALLQLVNAASPTIRASGERIALLGLAATACVLFRMVARPVAQEEVLSLSLAWGAWLALASSLAIVVGGLMSRGEGGAGHTETPAGTWKDLSGWTPGT